MFYYLASGLGVIAGIAAGLAAGVYAMGRMNRAKSRSGFALTSALFLSIGHGYNNRGQNLLLEAEDDTARKKNTVPGDPPLPGGHRFHIPASNGSANP
jgi:hypothetical protein